MEKIRLGDIAYARSGDKGSGANIGVIAYTEAGYHYLVEHVTLERVSHFLRTLGSNNGSRYEIPNLWALNFVFPEILAGGGSRSLRIDAQGKALGQVLLELPLEIPAALLVDCRRTSNGVQHV